MKASIVLELKQQGAADVRRAIGGMTSDLKKADEERRKARRQERAEERAAAEERRQARRRESQEDRKAFEARQDRRARERDDYRQSQFLERELFKEQIRNRERLTREEQRAARSRARDVERQQRAARRAAQQQQRRTDRFIGSDFGSDWTLPGMMAGPAGMTMAALAAGITYGQQNLQRMQGWQGLEDVDSILQRYAPLRMGLLTTATNAGMDVDELERLARENSAQRGIAPEETAAMLSELQDKYTDQLGAIMDHFALVNDYAIAFGTSPQAMADTAAIGMRDLGVTGDQIPTALAIEAASTQAGAVNIDQMTRDFGTIPNLLRGAWGGRASGEAGVRLFSALTQISGKSGLTTSAEMATTEERFLRELADPETWKRARRAGVHLTEGRGANEHLRDPRAVIEALMGSELDRPGAMQDIFQSIESQTYVRGLRGAGMSYFDQMYGVDAASGSELMRRQLEAKQRDEAFLAIQARGRRAAEVMGQGQDALHTARTQTGYISDWESRMATRLHPWISGTISGMASFGESVGSAKDSLWQSITGRNEDFHGGLNRALGVDQLPQWAQGALMANFPSLFRDDRAIMRRELGGPEIGASGGAHGGVPGIASDSPREATQQQIVRALDGLRSDVRGLGATLRPPGNAGSETARGGRE